MMQWRNYNSMIHEIIEKSNMLYLRCNLVTDCLDGSDEKDCDILEVPQDYRSELFPLTEDGSPLGRLIKK